MTVQVLKKELKDWEKSFFNIHQRKPTKQDIKKVPEIELKYKEYSKLKSGKLVQHNEKRGKVDKRKKIASNYNHVTSSKRIDHKYFNKADKELRESNRYGLETPEKSSPHRYTHFQAIPGSPQILGPTPQLNGKLISIFEIKITPTKEIENSPSSRKSILLTPSVKRRLDFQPDNSNQTGNTVMPISETLNDFTTPQKPGDTNYSIETSKNFSISTPSYLNQGNLKLKTPKTVQSIRRSPDKLISPSMLKNSKVLKRRKTLAELFHEMQKFKDETLNEAQELTLQVEESEFLSDFEDIQQGVLEVTNRLELTGNMGMSTNEFDSNLKIENSEELAKERNDSNAHKTPYWLKKKKIKRQTRRYKIKSRGVFHEDRGLDLDSEDAIQKEIRKLQENKLVEKSNFANEYDIYSEDDLELDNEIEESDGEMDI